MIKITIYYIKFIGVQFLMIIFLELKFLIFIQYFKTIHLGLKFFNEINHGNQR